MAFRPVPLFKVTLAAGAPGVGAVRAEAHQAMSVTGTLPPTMSTVKVMPEKRLCVVRGQSMVMYFLTFTLQDKLVLKEQVKTFFMITSQCSG